MSEHIDTHPTKGVTQITANENFLQGLVLEYGNKVIKYFIISRNFNMS